jgi:outer membrane protein assembly factor BamB
LLLTLANASPGRITMSPNGEMIVYVLDGQNNQLIKWNSSYASYNYPGTVGTNAWQWRPPIGTTQDWREGIQWNVSVPDVPGRQSIACIGDGVIVATSQADDITITAVGYNATTGAQKWAINISSNVAIRPTYFVVPASNGIFLFFRQETMEFYAYSLETGDLVWGPTKPYDSAWGMYTSSVVGLGASNPQIAYDTLYSVAYDGKIHAFDVKTGDTLWEFSTGSAGFETPYGTYPLGSGTFAIADGKIYAATGEHSPNAPMWRGGRIYCVDAYNGKGIWNLSGWWQNPAVADGYLTAFNNYDCKVYCIGKGQTATTVTATPGIGNVVTIQGTVTDQSPGQTCLGIPAAGTPAIADEYMTQWMEYLYMQKTMPSDATGVPVTLFISDQNGNIVDTIQTTSDITGHYATSWTPPSTGTYMITAAFDGTNSYFASTGKTAIAVGPTTGAATPAPTPDVVSPPTSDSPTTTYIIVITIAIIIVVAATALVLSKRSKSNLSSN